MEPTDVEDFTLFDEFPVFWLFQVRVVEVVGSSQVSDQGSVMARDQSGTFTCLVFSLVLIQGL